MQLEMHSILAEQSTVASRSMSCNSSAALFCLVVCGGWLNAMPTTMQMQFAIHSLAITINYMDNENWPQNWELSLFAFLVDWILLPGECDAMRLTAMILIYNCFADWLGCWIHFAVFNACLMMSELCMSFVLAVKALAQRESDINCRNSRAGTRRRQRRPRRQAQIENDPHSD